MKTVTTILLAALLASLLVTGTFATPLDPAQVISSITAQKEQLKSYEAVLITTMSGPYINGKQTQKAKTYFQAPDTTRTDTFAGLHQVTLKKGDLVQTFDSLGNSKDLNNEAPAQKGFSDPAELQKYVDFSAERTSANIVLTGITKTSETDSPLVKSKISRVIFLVNSQNYSVERAEVYNSSANAFVIITIDYRECNGLPFPIHSISSVQLPKTTDRMTVEIRYEQVQVNHTIDPDIFNAEAIKARLAKESEVE